MKIQLISAPFLETGRSHAFQPAMWPPLGILCLAAYLRQQYKGKLEIKLTDGGFIGEKETLKQIIDFQPDILGISSFTPNSTGGYYIANEVKKVLSKTFIIFGGVHASALPEDVYRRCSADLVAVGEGERTLLELVNHIAKKKKEKKL